MYQSYKLHFNGFQTSNSLLSIASSLTSALKVALDNPLSSDLAANLKYATDNYDDLYNVLPSDPDNIVYVEEMTQEEWAAYVTKMIQKNIAKTLANQLASTLDTLENTLAARAIATGNLPYDYSVTEKYFLLVFFMIILELRGWHWNGDCH